MPHLPKQLILSGFSVTFLHGTMTLRICRIWSDVRFSLSGAEAGPMRRGNLEGICGTEAVILNTFPGLSQSATQIVLAALFSCAVFVWPVNSGIGKFIAKDMMIQPANFRRAHDQQGNSHEFFKPLVCLH